jgi:uncharacterized cupin superfamily protein
MTERAKLEQTDAGTAVKSDGWFVLNIGDVTWMRSPNAGEWTQFETPPDGFPQYGIGIHVVHPGQPNGLYHAETMQEDFLVLHGECVLLIEGEEHRLRAWDFVHCPPGTHHIFVGAGDGPCAILMVGARSADNVLHYPRDELAARHGASAPEETNDPREAYREWPRDFKTVRATWPLA